MPKAPELRQRNREYDARRRAEKPWRALYSTSAWRGLRAAQLAKDPLCARCKARGRLTPATVAHHAIAHKGDPQLFFDPGNLVSSCAPCHDIDEQRIEKGGMARQDVGLDGWPIEDAGGAVKSLEVSGARPVGHSNTKFREIPENLGGEKLGAVLNSDDRKNELGYTRYSGAAVGLTSSRQ